MSYINKIQITKLEHYEIFKSNILKSNNLYDVGTNIYAGKCTITKKDIAVKHIILNNISKNKEAYIKNEIAAINFIINNPHKNIVKYMDLITVIERPNSISNMQNCRLDVIKDIYIIMEYDHSAIYLNKMLHIGYEFSEDVIRNYFIQILTAMIYLNDNNITCKNIRPENILICDGDNVKIDDFGFTVFYKFESEYNQNISKSIVDKCLESVTKYSTKENNMNNSEIVLSLGTILYEMMYRKPLYIQSIKTNDNEIMSYESQLNHFSNDCYDLLQKLVNKNINLKDILRHKWIITEPQIKNDINNDDKNNMDEKCDEIFDMEL